MVFRYSLLRDDDDAELGRFTAAFGLFDPGVPLGDDDTVTLRNGELRGHLLALAEGRTFSRVLGNTWIGVLGRDGTVLGRYYLACAEVGPTARSSEPGHLWDVVLTGNFLRPPTPAAEPIWKAFADGSIVALNAWARLSPEEKLAWLEVARLRQASRGPATDAPAGTTFELDATRVVDPLDFLCALGEAINGIGGYFGAGLDSLQDCLSGGFGARPPFVLNWHREPASAARPSASELSELIQTLVDSGVCIVGGMG
jgi:hypothetical protein